jgi:hypothetical protein
MTMKKIYYIISTLVLIAISTSCSKKREEQFPKNYSNATEFFQNNKEKEQEFVITSDEEDCIVAKKGTVICGSRKLLRTSSGDTITFPYSVKVVELYSLKDHILYGFPTASAGVPLKNDGSVRIKALKDGKETTLITGGRFTAKYSIDPSMDGNNVFKGTMTDDNFADWQIAGEGSTLLSPSSRDSLRLASFGWFQAAQNSYGSNLTTVSFELDGDGGESLDLWLVQSSNNTILHGSELKIQNVPIGQEMTAIVIAIDQDKNLVLHKSKFTVSSNEKVTIDFKEVKESALLSTLEGL